MVADHRLEQLHERPRGGRTGVVPQQLHEQERAIVRVGLDLDEPERQAAGLLLPPLEIIQVQEVETASGAVGSIRSVSSQSASASSRRPRRSRALPRVRWNVAAILGLSGLTRSRWSIASWRAPTGARRTSRPTVRTRRPEEDLCQEEASRPVFGIPRHEGTAP